MILVPEYDCKQERARREQDDSDLNLVTHCLALDPVKTRLALMVRSLAPYIQRYDAAISMCETPHRRC